VLADWSTATVGPDMHVKVGKSLYWVPWQFIEQKVDACATALMVQIFHHGQLIPTHGRKPAASRPSPGTTLRRRSPSR
jgi:hypothetical protein